MESVTSGGEFPITRCMQAEAKVTLMQLGLLLYRVRVGLGPGDLEGGPSQPLACRTQLRHPIPLAGASVHIASHLLVK